MSSVALELQPCCGNRSGIGVYAYELAKRVPSQGPLRFYGNLFNFLGRNDNRSSLEGIKIQMNESRLFPYGVYRRIWNFFPLSYGSLFPQAADLSVFFNYIVPPRIKGKVITTVYDLTYLRYPETMDAKNLRRIRSGIAYSIARSDRILTISDFTRQELIGLLRVPSEKIAVVPCAPNLSEETVSSEELTRKYGVHSPYLLYVGTIEPRKNLVQLLQAFSLLKQTAHIEHQLVIAGGSGWQTAAFHETLAQLPCRSEVILTGYVSTSEKNALYQNASVFVFPSLYEGFGIPPLEAMHFGCPVVCSDAASLPEVVGDAAVLANCNSAEDLAEAILRVLLNKSISDQLIARGAERVRSFTWERSAQLFQEVCESVMNE